MLLYKPYQCKKVMTQRVHDHSTYSPLVHKYSQNKEDTFKYHTHACETLMLMHTCMCEGDTNCITFSYILCLRYNFSDEIET